MGQSPRKIKTKLCRPIAKRKKFVSLEWNWISDRLEQPVQSRENLIPPVLFTRLILIRCEETAGREKRGSPVSGEETSCSFSRCEGAGESAGAGGFAQGPCAPSLPEGGGWPSSGFSVSLGQWMAGAVTHLSSGGFKKVGQIQQVPEWCSRCPRGPASRGFWVSPPTEISETSSWTAVENGHAVCSWRPNPCTRRIPRCPGGAVPPAPSRSG